MGKSDLKSLKGYVLGAVLCVLSAGCSAVTEFQLSVAGTPYVHCGAPPLGGVQGVTAPWMRFNFSLKNSSDSNIVIETIELVSVSGRNNSNVTPVTLDLEELFERFGTAIDAGEATNSDRRALLLEPNSTFSHEEYPLYASNLAVENNKALQLELRLRGWYGDLSTQKRNLAYETTFRTQIVENCITADQGQSP